MQRVCPPLSEQARLVFAATIAGVLAGLSACLLKYGIDEIGVKVTSHLTGNYGNLLLLIFPLIGIMLSVLYQRATKEDLAHGSAIIERRLQNGNLNVKRNMMWTPILGCILTIGFGGSAGAESPAALSGASIGSRAGGWFGLSKESVRILFACGAGAGIAGIFKSPVGGMLFTIEVLQVSLSAVAAISLVCSCMAAYSTAYVMSGFTWDVTFNAAIPFEPSRLGWILLLGLFCGLYSVYYRRSEKWIAGLLKKINNKWKKALIAGTVMSIMVYLLPPMFGEGFGIVSGLVNGDFHVMSFDSPFISTRAGLDMLIIATLVILLLKGIAVGIVNYGGGVAGEFAPTLFAGALAGFMFALALNHFFGLDLPVANFALIGMGAVMAGVIKAPLMAIFVATEISDSYSYILGFILAAGVSYLVVVLCSGANKPDHTNNTNAEDKESKENESNSDESLSVSSGTGVKQS